MASQQTEIEVLMICRSTILRPHPTNINAHYKPIKSILDKVHEQFQAIIYERRNTAEHKTKGSSRE